MLPVLHMVHEDIHSLSLGHSLNIYELICLFNSSFIEIVKLHCVQLLPVLHVVCGDVHSRISSNIYGLVYLYSFSLSK